MKGINMNYTDQNSKTIDRWIENDWEWGIPITHEQFVAAKNGDWQMVLTPTKPVPKGWYPELSGKKVLGLASGGGQQMPIFAALGADCTVLDYSEKQIASELTVASREGYHINAIRADMTKPLPFADESFDLIFHPVSNCYIEDLQPTWNECYRVLRHGGVLMAGWTNPIMYMFDDEALDSREAPLIVRNKLPYNGRLEVEKGAELTLDTGYQFSHTLEAQIGGQLKAGFMLKDFYEDSDPGIHLGAYTSLFAASLAVKL